MKRTNTLLWYSVLSEKEKLFAEYLHRHMCRFQASHRTYFSTFINCFSFHFGRPGFPRHASLVHLLYSLSQFSVDHHPVSDTWHQECEHTFFALASIWCLVASLLSHFTSRFQSFLFILIFSIIFSGFRNTLTLTLIFMRSDWRLLKYCVRLNGAHSDVSLMFKVTMKSKHFPICPYSFQLTNLIYIAFAFNRNVPRDARKYFSVLLPFSSNHQMYRYSQHKQQSQK